MTISVDNSLLRLGVPLLLLSFIFVFILINKKSLPLLLKTSSFQYYLAILCILLCSVGVAYKNSLPLMDSISAMLRFLLMGGFFVLGFILAIYGKQKTAMFFVASTIICHMLSGIIGYFFGLGDVIHGVLRPTGLTGKVNILANLALFSALFYGIQAFFGRENRVVLTSIAFLALIMIFFSSTLNNVISFVGAIGLYILLGAKRKFLTISLSVFIGIPLVIGLALYTPIGDRMMEAFNAGIDIEVEEGQKLESSLQWRILHWKLLIDDWSQRFFIFGAGFGQVSNLNALKSPSGEGFVAHSDWIQFLVELGPVLFILFIWAHFKMIRPLYRQARAGDAIALALFFAFVSQCIAMLAGPVYFSLSLFYYFWLLFGVFSASTVNVISNGETREK